MITPAELEAFLARGFPELATGDMSVLRVADHELELLLRVKSYHLRPGATVSGPTLMMLADTATWLALAAHLGPEVAVGAVTTSLSIHFLRRPPHDEDLRVHARLLKVGKRLCVAEVAIRGASSVQDAVRETEPVAHATVTYARAT
jgi:uncharacterized protein (TIGR00369 family)